jgi:hypothetical protein
MTHLPSPRARFRQTWGVFIPARDASPSERDAFREHLRSSFWGGITGGIVILTDVILAKTLQAPGWQVTLLATLGPAANLFSFYWAGAVLGRQKAGSFLLAVILGRIPLALLLLWRTSACMIMVNFLFAVATALLITATNAIYQTRYREDVRPLRFAVATSLQSAVAIVTTLLSGALLERHEGRFPWLFALAGITGVISAYHLYRMEASTGEKRDPISWMRIGIASLRRRVLPAGGDPVSPSLGSSLRLAAKVFRENPQFARFERNFMVYGFAFLSVLPVLPLYIVRELSMNYNQLSATKGLWSQIGVVLLSPVLGIALGRLRPLLFTGRVFLLLALYPICLLVSTIPGIPVRVTWVYAALFFYSIAMAGVNLSWTLGSMHFAGDQDASAFQGMHVALTGIRGLLAPSIGFAIYSLLGTAAIFAFSSVLFLMAGVLMLRQDRDIRSRGLYPPPQPSSPGG